MLVNFDLDLFTITNRRVQVEYAETGWKNAARPYTQAGFRRSVLGVALTRINDALSPFGDLAGFRVVATIQVNAEDPVAVYHETHTTRRINRRARHSRTVISPPVRVGR